MLTLLATGLMPVVGIKFAWVTIHWITGINVLVLLVVFHIVRALIWQRLSDMGIAAARSRNARAPSGKYTLAQRLMHDAMTAAVVALLITGVLMLFKIDTPLWKRNPYVFRSRHLGLHLRAAWFWRHCLALSSSSCTCISRSFRKIGCICARC